MTPTADPLRWRVEEAAFLDADAFRAHQARTGDSDWGRKTASIERHDEVTGL